MTEHKTTEELTEEQFLELVLDEQQKSARTGTRTPIKSYPY